MSFLKSLVKRKESVDPGTLLLEVRAAMLDVQAYARSHGGEIELLTVTEGGDVHIRFLGTCADCPMSPLTFKMGVEKRLRSLVPGVRKVVQLDA